MIVVTFSVSYLLLLFNLIWTFRFIKIYLQLLGSLVSSIAFIIDMYNAREREKESEVSFLSSLFNFNFLASIH